MYADDILYHQLIRDTFELEEVQSDVTKLEEWSDNHLLQLSPQKCKSMILSKKRYPTTRSVSLYLCGSELKEVEIYTAAFFLGQITFLNFALKQEGS